MEHTPTSSSSTSTGPPPSTQGRHGLTLTLDESTDNINNNGTNEESLFGGTLTAPAASASAMTSSIVEPTSMNDAGAIAKSQLALQHQWQMERGIPSQKSIVIDANTFQSTDYDTLRQSLPATASMHSAIHHPMTHHDKEDERSPSPIIASFASLTTPAASKQQAQRFLASKLHSTYKTRIIPSSPNQMIRSQVLCTKLRSWRTGYTRILCLLPHSFETRDALTYECTNAWSYDNITHVSAPMEDLGQGQGGGHGDEVIHLHVNGPQGAKLKFACTNRSRVLAELYQLLQAHSMSDQRRGSPMSMTLPFHSTFGAWRYTKKNGTSGFVQVVLSFTSHGICEHVGAIPNQNTLVQTYPYTHICGVSFMQATGTSETQSSSLCVHTHTGRLKVYKDLARSPSEFITVLQEGLRRVGKLLEMKPSVSWEELTSRRIELGSYEQVGECMGVFHVEKYSRRKQVIEGGTGWVERWLVVTRGGFLLECHASTTVEAKQETGNVVHCRSFKDLVSLVRCTESSTQFLLEYKDGSIRTYRSSQRDGTLVSLLDAAVNISRNFNVTVTDVVGTSLRLVALDSIEGFGSPTKRTSSSLGKASIMGAAAGLPPPPVGGLFPMEPLEAQCLKRIHAVACAAEAYISIGGKPIDRKEEDTETNPDPILECSAVMAISREFNANVSIVGICNLPHEEKLIVESISALWGIVLILFRHGYNDSSIDYKDSSSDTTSNTATESIEVERGRKSSIHLTLVPILQTLYRLMLTPIGYSTTTEDVIAMKALSVLWKVEDTFALYWYLKCASALVLPRPFAVERDTDSEHINKNHVLGQVPGIIGELLQCMVGVKGEQKSKVETSSRDSDLILMVASNIVESILCSHQDTTSPQHFAEFMNGLAKRHKGLISLLRSSTSMIMENSALMLNLIATHSPSTLDLVSEIALNTGILLQHLYYAIFSPLEGQRFLSRYLCSMLFSGRKECPQKCLLRRLVPEGFLGYLSMPPLGLAGKRYDRLMYLDKIPDTDGIESIVEEEQLDEMEVSKALENAGHRTTGTFQLAIGIDRTGSGTNIVRLRRRLSMHQSKESRTTTEKENFRIFFHVLTNDHSLPDLIWNEQTRHELQISLEHELELIAKETEKRGDINLIAWNHQQFSASFPSLRDEVRVGAIYLRLWLQTGDSFIKNWKEPVRLFELLFRRFLCDLDRDPVVSNMCIRCLERLFQIHSTKIGSFSDMIILVRIMEQTKNIETQRLLLSLISTLVGIKRGDDRYEEIHIPSNIEQLLNRECVDYLCRLVAWGHTDDPFLLMSDNKIAVESEIGTGYENNDPPLPPLAVWYVASPGNNPPDSTNVNGPFRTSQVVNMVKSGTLTRQSLVTESYRDDKSGNDTGNWQVIECHWQLRLQLYMAETSSEVNNAPEIALSALSILSRLINVHQSVDSRGIPFFPIPKAKRLICEASHLKLSNIDALSILCQSLLSGDSRIVETAATLIHAIMTHNNDMCERLYLTGVFFFIFVYTGSNFQSLARLLHATYFQQDYHICSDKKLPDTFSKENSILVDILPDGLLKVLINHGPENFAEAFVGNVDTPEVIWSYGMRSHLTIMIRQHLGDFLGNLSQNTITKYEFCPIPKVSYQCLGKELFCHHYYLRNLCDPRFEKWPITEPAEVFHSCLQKWNDLISRDSLHDHDAQDHAREVLGLEKGYDEEALRRAYVSLSKTCYLHKNPSERSNFQMVKKSFELLLPIFENGGKLNGMKVDGTEDDIASAEGIRGGWMHLQSIKLLMHTQLLIYNRYPEEIAKYKYPAYKLLLSCIIIPTSVDQEKGDKIGKCCLLRAKRIQFTKIAIDLLFHTCLVSPLNADELIRENGVNVLHSLLGFYIEAFSCISKRKEKSLLESDLVEIVTIIVHVLSGISYYENGRDSIARLNDMSQFCANWRRCLDLGFLPWKDEKASLIRTYALEGLANMSKCLVLQTQFISSGVVWPLLSCMMEYHLSVVPNDGTSPKDSDANVHARLSARALGMLCGIMRGDLSTEPNEQCFNAIKNILTEPIAVMLRNENSSEVLRTLNLNVETPLRVWDNKMREELENFVKRMDKDHGVHQDLSMMLSSCESFQYSNLSNEVNIGGVYIRIFNGFEGSRESIRDIVDCSEFARALVLFLKACLEKSGLSWEKEKLSENGKNEEVGDSLHSTTDSAFPMVVMSLLYLIRLDGLIDDLMCESEIVGSLLNLLVISSDNEAFDHVKDILMLLSEKPKFASTVSNCRSLPYLLHFLLIDGDGENNIRKSIKLKELGWSVFRNLASSASINNVLISTSGWLELLAIISKCNGFSTLSIGREGAAKVLSCILLESSTYEKCLSLLQKFLPVTLIEILRENGSQQMIEVFDQDSETPALIWDATMRGELKQAISDKLKIQMCKKSDDKLSMCSKDFVLSDGYICSYKKIENEIYISGIYVRLLLREPSFQLREPAAFFEELLLQWSYEIDERINRTEYEEEITASLSQTLECLTNAVIYICQSQVHLSAFLAEWGYMEKALSYLQNIIGEATKDAAMTSIVKVIHQASHHIANIEALALLGDNDGKNGVVHCMILAVGNQQLHPEASMILGALEQVFKCALGDVAATLKSASDNTKAESTGINGPYAYEHTSLSTLISVAPSPAPGIEPVKKLKTADHDHPLAMMFDSDTQSQNITARRGVVNAQPNGRNNRMMPQRNIQLSQTSSNGNAPVTVQRRSVESSAQPNQMRKKTFESSVQQKRVSSSTVSRTSVHSSVQKTQILRNPTQKQQHHTRLQDSSPSLQTRNKKSNSHLVPTSSHKIATQHTNNRYSPSKRLMTSTSVQASPLCVTKTTNNPLSNVSLGPTRLESSQIREQRTSNVNTQFHASSNLSTVHQGKREQIASPGHDSMVASGQITSQGINGNHGSSDISLANAKLVASQANHVMDSGAIESRRNSSTHGVQGAERNGAINSEVQHVSLHQGTDLFSPSPLGVPVNSTFAQKKDSNQWPTSVLTDAQHYDNPLEAQVIEEKASLSYDQLHFSKGAPGSANGRTALLFAALQCDLVPFLVNDVLENPLLSSVKEPASAEAHSVGLLNLLLKDPGFGLKFKGILNELPSWKKYSSREHPLFENSCKDGVPKG